MKNIYRSLLFILVSVFYLSFNSYGQADTSFIPCTAEFIDTVSHDSTSNGFAPTDFLWDEGQTLRVRYMGGTPFVREKVTRYAKEWEEYANINFEFVTDGFAEIRIAFDAGHYSYIGTGALNIPQDQKTMNLQFNDNTPESEFRRVTQHEFGHVLGLNHEHQHPESNIQWNEEAVYEFYARCHGWSRNTTFWNILRTFTSAGHHHCTYDLASIMHYPVQNELTLNNFSVPLNTVLSEEDKSFMSLLYPDDGNRDDSECGFCVIDCDDNNLNIIIRGEGSVTINPIGGNNTTCVTNCIQQFSNNQIVNISANPQTGYRFVRWEGSSCNNGTGSSCQFVMDTNHSMTAIFEPEGVNDESLNIEITGMGSVTIATTGTNQVCNNSCTLNLPIQTNINLSAQAAAGYRFVRFEGDRCNGSVSPSCAFSLNRNLSVRAIFEAISTTNSLTINVSGNGSVVTTTNNSSLTCNNACSYNFDQNSSVTTQAMAANGFQFVRWEGNRCNLGTNPSCNFTLTANLVMTAIFEPIPVPNHTLGITIIGSGEVRANTINTNQSCTNDCNLTFPNQTAISLEAVAIAGHRFVQWEEGECNTSITATCSFILSSDLNLRAIFEPIPTNVDSKITIELEGLGSVMVIKNNQILKECEGSCSFIFSEPNPVEIILIATPADGFEFDRWDGDFCHLWQQTTCSFPLNNTKEIKAIFKEKLDPNCFTFELDPRTVSCNTGLVFVDIENGTSPFQINLSGPISGEGSTNSNSFAITDLTAGFYTFTIRDGNNCVVSKTFSIANTCSNVVGAVGNSIVSPTVTSINLETPEVARAKLLAETSFQVASISPNPFVNSTQLPIQLTIPSKLKLEIIHISGKKVYQQQYDLGIGKHMLPLNSQIFQSSGVYMYRLSSRANTVTGKIIKL